MLTALMLCFLDRRLFGQKRRAKRLKKVSIAFIFFSNSTKMNIFAKNKQLLNSYEKIKLIGRDGSFSVVDGKLHDRELQFLTLVADELQIKPRL
jgi:hypothetical protein